MITLLLLLIIIVLVFGTGAIGKGVNVFSALLALGLIFAFCYSLIKDVYAFFKAFSNAIKTDDWLFIIKFFGFIVAIVFGIYLIFKLFFRYIERNTSEVVTQEKDELFISVIKGDVDAVKMALATRKHYHVKCNDGWTPLMLACRNGNIEIVSLLLKSKALVNEVNRYNETALTHAKVRGHDRIVMLLRGANAKFINPNSMTLISCIEDNNAKGVIACINSYRINPDTVSSTGVPALILAIEKANLKMVKNMLHNKANPNIVAPSGRTPWICAQYFLGINSYDPESQDSLALQEIVMLLKRYGATT
ncbi:MAG: ankX 1 [Paenibacillus sp.]|nr:ankX 1 [Paenibacillus sp.]